MRMAQVCSLLGQLVPRSALSPDSTAQVRGLERPLVPSNVPFQTGLAAWAAGDFSTENNFLLKFEHVSQCPLLPQTGATQILGQRCPHSSQLHLPQAHCCGHCAAGVGNLLMCEDARSLGHTPGGSQSLIAEGFFPCASQHGAAGRLPSALPFRFSQKAS